MDSKLKNKLKKQAKKGSEYQDKSCIFLKSKHSCTLRLPLCNDGFKSRLNMYQ